jgi:predicted PurR-regulated permease PerM
MMPQDDPRRLILWTIAMLFGGIVTLWVLYLIRGVLLAVYVSTLLAIGFSPMVRWLERRHFVGGKTGLPRWAAILILYVGILVTLSVVVALVLPPLLSQASDLWRQLPHYVTQLKALLNRYGLRSGWPDLLQELPSPSLAVAGVLGALQSVIGAIGTFVTILLLPYYMLVESDSLEAGLLRLVPPGQRPAVARVSRDVAVKVGAWVGGQLVLCLTIGVTASIGLWILGVPFFYVLGLVAGIGEFVPIVGPLVAAVPAVLVGWTVSFHTALFVAAYFSIQQFIEGSVLVPRIMERQVGVRAVTIVLALLIGTDLFGVIGALLAVPTAAIVQVLLQEYFQREDT